MKQMSRIVAMCLMLSACGKTKTIDGVTYDVFGIANQHDKQNPGIDYEVSISSVVVAVIFVETIIVPIYILLFDLWEPVGKAPTIIGQVVR